MRRAREQDAVAAALADVQARQQSLSRGAVLPRAAPPAAEPPTPRTAREPPPPRAPAFQWLQRRVVRRSERADSALEDLGRLELLPSASLAAARALVAQFVALPARRDFVFVHPTTGARVADEAAVRAADLPFLCIALLPVKETAAVSGAAAAVEKQRRPRPGTAQPLPLQQQQTKQRPQTVESRAKRHAATPATDTNSSSEGGVVPKAKEKRFPLEKVSNTHEPRQSPEKDRGKQSNEKRVAESVPLRAPPKHVMSKKMDTEAKFTPDSKRASSAGLTATSRVTSNLTKTDMREAFENQTTKPRRRKTSVLIPKAANTSSTREPESPVNTSSTDLGTETLQFEQMNVGPGAMETALASSTNQEVVTGDGTHAIFPAAPAIPEEPSSSDISINLQTPGHLRRSRRFKALTAAKLSEKSWAEDPEQCEVITDAQIEEFIRSMLDAFHTGMEGIDGHELDKSLLYYGVDYRPLELHGILLAWDTELAVRCNHVRGGVDGQLTQYLLKVLPVEGDVTLDDERLRQFEYTLNVFAAMRGWSIFTKLRAGCFEEKYPLQLIPPSDSRRLALLRLSDKDRQLFALATSDNSSVRFESWLADGMEITYVLLFGFLQSRRNSGPKALAKLDSLNLRQARIQAAIQKLSSFSFEVWKRLEFRTTDIEDPSMLTRLNELIKPFLRDSKLYSGELEGSVFLPSLIGYLNRKAAQLSQSLCGLLQSTHSTREPIQNTVLQCLRLLRQNLMQLELHSANLLTYVQTMGLKIFDVDKINATRTSSGLGRIYVNGKESMLTHHQCKLMTRDRDLKLKARWDQQQDLRNGEVSRYFFIGPKEVALEYVVIRSKPLRNGCCPVSWEERDALGRKEALQAFALLSDRLTSDALSSAAVGVGINIIHTDLLPHVGSLQCLFAILGEYPKATSISFGYCYDAASQATRVVFRVHADKSIGNYNKEGCSDLMSALRGVDRFLMSAEEDEGVAFCEAEGLRFLNSCLHGRERPWNFIKYGKTFIKYISMLGGTDSERLHEGILQALKRTLAIFPCAPNLITKENLNVIASLIDASSNASDIADDAVNVLQSMSSKRNKFKMTQPPHEILVFPMTETQKRFASQGGIDILMKTVMELAEDSARSQALQIAIIEILMTREISATTSGLLVHWREVLEFYVEKKAWIRHPVTPAYSAFLLRQIHTNFFSSSSFMEPVVEPCPCNCKRCSLDLIDSYSGIMQIFVKLMLTEAGVAWAQEEMYGPRNCVLFLKWSAHLDQCIPAMANLQEAIVQGLCDFLDRLTSSHQYLRLLSDIVPLLLELLHQQNCSSLHAGALRVLSLTFRLAVDKKVWTIKMGTFLAAYYQVLESFCDDPSLSNMNSVMNNTLLNSNQQKQTIICSHILILLHEEHINFIGGSGQLSPVARSRTKSLLQTLASFCSLTWNSVLHPVCQIPALISLGWMLTSLEVAKDLIVLEMDDVLLALMDNENVVVSILATRALVVLLFQTLFSPLPRTIEQYRLKRLCNLLTTVLGSGSRLMLSPKRTSDVDNLQSIQFAANLHDSFLILLRYRTFNIDMENYDKENELEQENAPGAEWPAVHAIVASYEWNEPNRAAAEKLAIHLKLLAVFSAMTSTVISIGSSDEMREIILLLVRFIRERMHSASHHTILYLLPLRNIVWATRSEIIKWGVSELTEPSFLRKLLLLSKDRLYQELASGILWGLAETYEKSNTFLLSFEVDDALATGSYFVKKNGFAVLVDSLASKVASSRFIESDSGAVASMIVNPGSSAFFLSNYGYSFVLKMVESMMRLIRARLDVGMVHRTRDDTDLMSTSESFGTSLFYVYPIEDAHERELFQLCRAAVNALESMQRANPESIMDEVARTKTTMLPLLDYPNKQIALHSVLCICVHLQTNPTKCDKLLDLEVLDKVIALFFADEYPPIQAAAFSCIKLAFADQKCLPRLQLKLFPFREKIVRCLRSPHFDVKKKAILFLVEAVFRLDDQIFLNGVAMAFTATDNRGLLMELFDSVSNEITLNPSAGTLLQLLVRLILKLDLVVHTGGDQLVHVICLTLKAHCDDTFLRPMLFNFLHQIITQGDHVEYLERKSRLDVITQLLSQQLTQNELRNVANMLLSVVTKRDSIRHYLSGFPSRCIPKIVGVMDSFSEYIQNGDTTEKPMPVRDQTLSGLRNSQEDGGENVVTLPDENQVNYMLKMSAARVVYISHFTEDIYEKFLQLLLLLINTEFSTEERYGCLCEHGCFNCSPCDIIAKAHCGHFILRLMAAQRISCPIFDLDYLLTANGEPADSILYLCVELLNVLALSYQSRLQMIKGLVKMESLWLPPLLTTAIFSESSVDCGSLGSRELYSVHSIQLLGHLSATKDIAYRLITERSFISRLFSYLTPTDPFYTLNAKLRRAASFTLARLAEYPRIVRDTLFQEKMALLWHASMNSEEENSGKESDTIVLANMMILARNRALLTPGLQGRSADEGIISQLAHLLVIGQFALKEVALLASDVLANLLYVQVDVRSEKQLRAVLWRYTRAMSPNKPTQDPNHPSSKRLTAYLHNWIEPMLHKLRQSSFGTFHEDHTQLLGEELAFTLQNLEQPSVAALLCMLVSLHLPVLRQDDYEMGKNNNELEDEDLDTIPPYKYEETKPCRAQSLQYVFGASERSVREANDSSFSGSAHLWLFLRKLLDLANDELQDENTVAQEAISEVKDIVVNRVPLIFKCWSTVKDNKFSTVAFDRRKHFLDFVIAVGKIDGRLSSMVDGKDMVGLVVNCVPDFATIQGRDYLLVCNVCKHNPTNIDLVMQRFGFDNSQLGTTPSEFFRLFWSPVRLNLLPVKFSIGDRTKLEILDPSSEVNLTTIFGLELLRILAARFPNIVLWYAQCHGHSQLLEIMLLASKVSALQMQHILVRTFLSNLLDLINQLVDIAPTRYHRIFSSDPRYLRCIVGLIYAPAHEVQTTAIKLLQNLAQQPRIFGMLSRLENLVEPLATVNTEVVSYVGETVAIYELSPPLSQNSMILLAHLLFVPFFTDITFTELVKLAFGFNPCGHSTQDVWIIAMNDGNFNAIPDWMIVANDVMETAFTPAIKRMQKRFDTSIGGHREKSFYGIDKTAYFYHTSDMTRKRIGMRLSKLIKTYNDDKNVYRGSMRARNGLVMRLCRLLVEDRAEIIRRVAYTKRISERVLLEQMRSRTLSDLLLLLQEAPIFEGIQRDILACLAFRLGEPTEFIIDEPGSIQKLPLVLIFNEFVEFEMHIPHTQDSFRGTVSRGGLLGFPPWLEGKKGMEYSFIVHKCGLLATVISMEALEAELPESALGLVYQRLRLAYAAGDIQAISYLTGLGSVPALKPERRLQMSASSLIVQLTTAEVFVNSLLNDEWAVGVIADVALGVLSAPIVLDALTILAAMTANEVYTERFCVKLSATRHWMKEKERVTIDSPLGPLARFVNQFKLRLWEDHPAILEQLFLLQFHASSHLHTFWGNLESIWTLGYLRSCLAMLRSNIGTTADAIGYHLSSAIPHRLDYILFSGHKLQLHLEIAKVIIRTESGNAVGKLKLFNALCTDELLREEMWIAVLNAPCNVGPILKFLAPAITDAMDSQNLGDLETYCTFIYLLCSSNTCVDAQLDAELRCAIQNNFGIFSILIQGLHKLPAGHTIHIVLQCIGSICIQAPSNCYFAASSVDFTSFVAKTFEKLAMSLADHSVLIPLEIEATFACITAVTSLPNQTKYFPTETTPLQASFLFKTALQVLRQLTSASKPLARQAIAAARSVVAAMVSAATGNANSFIDEFSEPNIQILCNGYERVSLLFSEANDNLQLLWLLTEYAVLLNCLLSLPSIRDVLWVSYLSRDESYKPFFTWACHWMVLNIHKWPHICALEQDRGAKLKLLMTAADKMQAETLSVVVHLCKHESIAEVISLQPRFGDVVIRIFTALHSYSHELDVKLVRLRLKVVCFIAEQLGTRIHINQWKSDSRRWNVLNSFCRHGNVSTLVTLCERVTGDSVIECYAVRLLWLLARLTVSINASFNDNEISSQEWRELVPFIKLVLNSTSSLARTKSYVVGLLAELALAQRLTMNEHMDLVWETLKLIHGSILKFPVNTIRTLASSITSEYLSSRHWIVDDDSPMHESDCALWFALSYESQRYVLHVTILREGSLRLLNADFFPPLMCQTLLCDAITILSVNAESELWTQAQMYALRLIRWLMAFPEKEAEERSQIDACLAALQSYRLVGQREQFLTHCTNLFSKLWMRQFRCTVVEAMTAYVHQNIGASLEVATLREQGKVDLMAILLEILHTETEEIHVEESNIVGKCLQLFNAIIEFSLINAVYAAQPGSMRILSDLREKAIQQDLLITSDLPRTLFLIVRMLSGTTINSHQYLVNEVWEVARAILLHPFLDIRLDSAKYVLEVMGHSRMMRAELHSIITREWERCGKNVVVRLTNLLFSKPPVNSPAESIDQSIVILLVDAITQMCFSETLGECIQNDMQIVSIILRDYSYPWSVYQAQLINTLLAHNKLTQKHSHLSVQLFSPSDGIPTLHRQILLLNVLPSLTLVHCSLHIESRDEFWNDILHCIVRELGTNTEGKQYHTNLLTATKALVVVLDFCDLRSIPSKIIFELREVLAQQVHVVRASNPYQKPQSYTPVLLADECILLEGATQKKQLELLELLSFSCLSKLFAVSATDELLVERYGTSCLEQWIRCSSCRDSNAEDDAILTFFNPLISYCLEYARQSEPFKVAADSRSYWRILTRLFASYQCVSFHYWIVKLLLQLFQGSQRSAFEHFTANNFKMDFIEILWWKVSALKNEINFRAGDLRTLWYSLTNELCCNRKNALAIMERGFLEKFILWEDDLSTKTVLQSVRSAKLLRLLSSVFQGTSPQDHMHFFRNNPLIMEMLAERCINTIISISRMNEVKRDATLVLFTLTEHEPALASIRKMCCLNPFEGLRADVISSVQLREVSEMLLQCEGDLGSLVLVLRLVLKICESSYSVAALIHSRNDSECWPITSVLVDILEQCIRGATRPTQLENCVLRPILITTRIPANFLPFHLLDMLHTEATVLSLQLVHLCVADELVANSLESDTDLLGLLLACLATSNLEVSSTAAVVISSLIRRAPGTSDTFSDISQYVCEQGVYRYFEFFSDINTQTMQFISSPSEFPACFTLLLRWLRYYSLNLSLLNRSASKPNVHSTLGTATESVLYGYHEILTSSILELMLYIVSNYYFKIYRSSCGEADKSEHTLLLQSLLALCQRRSRTVESPDFEINSEDDTCIVSSSRVRSRALALVQLFCSLDLPFVSSREVFTNSQQMTILMTIIEQSRSTVEQRAAAQLMQELSLNDEIKQLIIGTSSLLLRLGAWLEMEALQLLAAAIVQRLATPSSKTTSSTNVSVFGFMPSVHLQLAQYLFVGLYPLTNHVSKTKRAVVSRCSQIHVTVLLEKDSHRQSGSNFVSTSVSVRMKFKIISSSGFCLRQFEYDTTFRNVVDSWHHDFLLEEAANIVLCTMYVQSTAGSGNLTTSKVKFTVGDGSFVYRSNSVTLEITEKVIKPNSASAGVVSRLLRQESNQLSLKLFKELMGIVVEFCKDYNIFCDSIIDLPSQILLVLATTVKFSTVGKMDVACFEALATWFPKNPSSSTFKSSVLPVLDLVGRLRQLACVNNPNGQIVLVTKPDNYSPSTASNFLDKLIELLASVEIGDISTTCLSKLFIENADVLLYLCAQFNPSQSTHTTFLSLVALALRNNAESCMVFSTQCGQRVLRIVFDAGIDQLAEQSEQALGKLLCYAALVVVRLARCPLFRRNFLLGMNDVRLFSRVAYELFARRPWVEYFPVDAAESLILGCGFLCNGLPKAVLVDSNTREGEYFASLFTTSSIFDDGLSIVETLLIFLGRPYYSGFHHETTMNQIGVSSSDRLAASVLASLVEKLTPRIKFEQTLLQILEVRQQINRPKTGDMVLSDPAKMLYKTLEQQCVLGMRNCIRLTRYDFQSDLNILRLTYYSGIRAGVRTGIIPAQCSGALQRFDQDHLLPTDNLQWHLNPKTFNRNSHLWQSSEENNGNVSSSKSLLAEDPELDLELRQLSLFANEHAELLSVLTVNRKKAMTTAIRVATRNARVLAAFHAMASIALDFYVDTVRMLQMKQKTKRNHNANENLVSFQMHGKGGDSEHTKFQEWLLLLEELAGLLCAGLHELDANYYLEIAHQFRSLILDLPIFLRKMERNGIHSRQQIIMLFLDNLHRLLKRATNRNELKVVAANGSGIVDQTKLIRERLRGLDVDISKSLGELLESPQGLENLSRSLVAMQYMWRRIMGSNSLEKAMASSKESASLLRKLAQKIMMLLERLKHPLVAIRNGFRTNTKKYQAEEFDMPIDVKSPRVLNSISTNQSQNGIDSDGISSGGKNVDKLTSSFPFTSLELLLDHFGWDSIRSKRVKQLLQSSKPNNPVVAEIASAFGVQKEIVEKMTVLDLAECFHELESRKKPSEIYHKLQRVVLEMDVPFTHIPFVTCDKFEMSLWRLMVRPIQRVRQFHLYQQMQLFVQSDTVKRQVLLNKYRQISPERPNSDVPRDTFTNKSDHANLSPNEVRSACKRLGFVFKKERQVAGESIEEGAPPPAGPWNSMPLPIMVISQSTLQVCDGIFNRDPFSDDAAMTLLRRKLKTKKIKQSTNLRWFRDLLAQSGRSLQYRYDRQTSTVNGIVRGVILLGSRLILMIAFWRHEELHADLQDPVMIRAFDNSHERDEYFYLYHAKKGLGELVRVWMPTSGRLGLHLWQERHYALGGTLLSFIIALWIPTLCFSEIKANVAALSRRNIIMTRIVYSYGVAIFVLSVVSIILIARNRFVLLEQTRLRIRPVSRYYQNVLAVVAILVELVQLNSLAFDSAVKWDETDELPGAMQWLGNQGITKFGVSSVSDLQAFGIVLLLLSWFLLLKCANKFQDTSVLLHRVLTKDLPALVHGFLYMSTISVFFSYLACVDCSGEHGSNFTKCKSDPESPPFLIAHQSIECWTSGHQRYALLGLWGITFFLPIGLLAHGMSQVLFQRETLDIKYAPVLLLVAQLVKAVAATAKAFFPGDPLVLASLGVIGNAVLLVITLVMHSCSLWYIKYVKSSIYAASCWASLGAIHRLHYAGQSSTRSLNMIYFGWLTIGLTTAGAILVRVWRHSQTKQQESEQRLAAQQWLLSTANSADSMLGALEHKFLKAAEKRSRDDWARATFVANANKLNVSAPPPALKDFMKKARELPGSAHEEADGALFMKNARVMAKKIRHQDLRRRRW